MKEGGNEIRISVGQSQAGRFGIELERMTDLALVFKFHRPEVASSRIRFVAEPAIELLPIFKLRDGSAGEVKRVIEPESI